jgi:hypothetical protein
MPKKLRRRPTRAAVLRSLRELEILWRPPDPDPGNYNARRAPGADEAANHFGGSPTSKGGGSPHSTPVRGGRKGAP